MSHLARRLLKGRAASVKHERRFLEQADPLCAIAQARRMLQDAELSDGAGTQFMRWCVVRGDGGRGRLNPTV